MKNQSELMRVHHAKRTGVSIGKEFIDLERQTQLEIAKRSIELRQKYSLDMDRTIPRKYWYGEVYFITDFEPMPKIYPKQITPIPQPHDGIETIASCFGRKEKCYLPKKNIAF